MGKKRRSLPFPTRSSKICSWLKSMRGNCKMIGIHKGKLVDWCNNNIDLLIIAAGAAILFSTNQFGNRLNLDGRWQDSAFWILLSGVITLSIGTSAFICYRVLLKWHGFFG